MRQMPGRLCTAAIAAACRNRRVPLAVARVELQMNGKTILITGATDGVGRAVATALGRPGAKVLVHGRNATRAGEVVAGIRDAGREAVFYPADFSSLAEVRAL